MVVYAYFNISYSEAFPKPSLRGAALTNIWIAYVSNGVESKHIGDTQVTALFPSGILFSTSMTNNTSATKARESIIAGNIKVTLASKELTAVPQLPIETTRPYGPENTTNPSTSGSATTTSTSTTSTARTGTGTFTLTLYFDADFDETFDYNNFRTQAPLDFTRALAIVGFDAPVLQVSLRRLYPTGFHATLSFGRGQQNTVELVRQYIRAERLPVRFGPLVTASLDMPVTTTEKPGSFPVRIVFQASFSDMFGPGGASTRPKFVAGLVSELVRYGIERRHIGPIRLYEGSIVAEVILRTRGAESRTTAFANDPENSITLNGVSYSVAPPPASTPTPPPSTNQVSTTTSTTPKVELQESTGNDAPIGAAVGGAVGGIVVVAALVALVIVRKRRQRSRTSAGGNYGNSGSRNAELSKEAVYLNAAYEENPTPGAQQEYTDTTIERDAEHDGSLADAAAKADLTKPSVAIASLWGVDEAEGQAQTETDTLLRITTSNTSSALWGSADFEEPAAEPSSFDVIVDEADVTEIKSFLEEVAPPTDIATATLDDGNNITFADC